MTEWKALCAELLHAVQSYLLFTDVDTTTADQRAKRVDDAMNAARAALAQHAPPAEGEELTNEEIDELAWNWYSKTGSTWYQIKAHRALARAAIALDRSRRAHALPTPLSENV